MQASPLPGQGMWGCRGDPRVARSPGACGIGPSPNATNDPITMDHATHRNRRRAPFFDPHAQSSRRVAPAQQMTMRGVEWRLKKNCELSTVNCRPSTDNRRLTTRRSPGPRSRRETPRDLHRRTSRLEWKHAFPTPRRPHGLSLRMLTDFVPHGVDGNTARRWGTNRRNDDHHDDHVARRRRRHN